ncbi:MAG TPA: aspartate carbamoyltransferase regulatory subunit [Candidatus Altiarchaeales archaeon]|nr:aspartate carbamoyltransferase regulatory subunit [Candidatus Altiarchaeales archaeon]HEX55041.1 aspartate carbamoyltransferase regulatory subunit [Candidatus Altiarchaeales archaeon]
MNGKEDRVLKIKTIKDGIVIDHISHGRAPDVLQILGIDNQFKDSVTIAMNVPSKILGKKDIVKVENRDIDSNEINKIAIIAPNATINKIRNYRVVEKKKVTLPRSIVGILRCPNPSCITNKEREPVRSVFIVKQKDPLVLACKYCEREISGEDITLSITT